MLAKLQARRISLRDSLATVFLLVSVWMLLLGPATENETYVVLAPAASLVAVEALFGSYSKTARFVGLSAFALLLAAVLKKQSVSPFEKPMVYDDSAGGCAAACWPRFSPQISLVRLLGSYRDEQSGICLI